MNVTSLETVTDHSMKQLACKPTVFSNWLS